MELLLPSYLGVSVIEVVKNKHETKNLPITCHNVAVGTGMSYHIIIIRRYIPVRATGMVPKEMCNKDMTGHIIVLHRYGPL